jgi:hypothetical protein
MTSDDALARRLRRIALALREWAPRDAHGIVPLALQQWADSVEAAATRLTAAVPTDLVVRDAAERIAQLVFAPVSFLGTPEARRNRTEFVEQCASEIADALTLRMRGRSPGPRFVEGAREQPNLAERRPSGK